MYVAGCSEESITSLLVGGGVFKFVSVFGNAWPTVCAIDAELAPFYGALMVG